MRFYVTERGSFRRCRRQAYLSSKNGRHLTTLSSPLALNTGTIIHRAHQLWMLKPDEPLSLHALAAGHEAQERIKNNYRAKVGTVPSPEEMLVTYEAIDIAMKMCDNYAIKYGTPIPEGYTLYAPEQKIRVDVPDTACECDNCGGSGQVLIPNELGRYHDATKPCDECNGTGYIVHSLEGKLDGLLLDPNGNPVVLEKKTYDRKPADVAIRGNDQFTAYVWLVMQLRLMDGVPSILYDGMWRREKAPRGRVFDDLFYRTVLTRNLAQIQEFGKFLPLELNAMAELYKHPETAYPNRPWMGCADCRLENLCYSISRGEDYESLIRSDYTARQDDLDDTDD